MPVVMGSQRHAPYTAPPADYIYITPGAYTMTIPVGVTSIGVIGVGAGANGDRQRGGGGGAISFRTNYAVTPGDVLSIEVCAPGAASVVNTGVNGRGIASVKKGTTFIMYAMGANGSLPGTYQLGSTGGADSSSGGGDPGSTSTGSSGQKGTGGGGAGVGGYTFVGTPSGAGRGGGNGFTGYDLNTSALAGSGGAAGGEINLAVSPNVRDGGGGGGIGIFGLGTTGTALAGTIGRGGQGGSPYSITVNGITYNFGTDGVSAGTSTAHIRPDGGFPGGGGGGSYDGAGFAGLGGGGVVRIFWGSGRTFPSNVLPSDNITIF